MNSFSKLSLTLLLNLAVSVPVYAKLEKQKTLNFPIQTEKLIQGDINFFTTIMSPREMAVKYPELFEIDSLSLFQEPDSMILLSKAVFVINKPVGFFDDKQLSDEKYVSYIMGEQKTKKLGPATYRVSVQGEHAHSFKMQMFFDADDVSTLPNSKIIGAVGGAKKLDIISQGASTIMFTELTNYTKHFLGGVQVASFIPLKENKTLVIQYNVKAMKKSEAKDERKLSIGLEDEMMANKDFMENYK